MADLFDFQVTILLHPRPPGKAALYFYNVIKHWSGVKNAPADCGRPSAHPRNQRKAPLHFGPC